MAPADMACERPVMRNGQGGYVERERDANPAHAMFGIASIMNRTRAAGRCREHAERVDAKDVDH